MNADDYQKLKDIFNSAVELPPEGRGAFLDERCNGDKALRNDVERLLNSIDSEFLEAPAAEPFSEPEPASSSRSGQRIGHYEVIRRIGSGGMGDVYLAVDGKLGRQVAIKILPDEFTTDENRLDRFQLEARSASSLSHPNILTIFEIGEWEGTHYIATEYVEGETLRQRLSRERLSIAESMDLGIQLASAIAAAHEASICHRDIKPENIMIRRDGLLKVVDFGLAKLVASPFRSGSSPTLNDEPTVKIVNTEPGVIMGTVQYMSPEQTRGLATDERSDIWSLGCVLYEMLTGHAPFRGDSSADMVAEIVKTHPELPSRLASDIPERLDEIISKSLEKRPDERYQTAKDLLIDLKRLKRNLELEDVLERSNPSMRTEPITAVTSGPNIISTKKGPKDLTEVNSAQYLYWGMKAHRWTTIGLTLFVISLVGGTAMLVRYYWRDPVKVRLPFETHDIERVTLNGNASSPALSKDGKYLAYFNLEGTVKRLMVRQVATGSEIQVNPPNDTSRIQALQFSPDGNFLYYVVYGDQIGILYRVATLGGSPKQILVDIDSEVSFSPNGDRFAFIRSDPIRKTSSVIISDIAGAKPEPAFTSGNMGEFAGVQWSPIDDRLLIASVEGATPGYRSFVVKVADLATKQIETLRHENLVLRSFKWLKDGTGALLTGQKRRFGPIEIWTLAFSDHMLRRVSNDPSNYSSVSTVANTNMFAAERSQSNSSLWEIDLDARKVRQLKSETPEMFGVQGIEILPNNDLLLTRLESGRTNIVLTGPTFEIKTRLTDADTETTNRHPKLTPDGRYILFASNRGGGPIRLWRMDLDGSNAIQLTAAVPESDTEPTMLSDNSTIIFTRDRGLWNSQIMKTTVDRRDIQPVYSDENASFGFPSVSHDGKLMAYSAQTYDSATSMYKTIMKVSELKEGNLFPTGRAVNLGSFYPVWTPCEWTFSNRLVCINGQDDANLLLSGRGGGIPERLTNFDRGTIQSLRISPDGKRIVFTRVFYNSDIYLVRDKAE